MEFEEVRDKVLSNIDVLIKEKQLLLSYLVYILGLIDYSFDDLEIKSYAKSQIGSYIMAMIERAGAEHEINEMILEYLDSLEYSQEFDFSSKKEMIIDFIKILESSYFKRAKNYSRITDSYYRLVKGRIKIPGLLEISDDTNYIDQKKYQMMKDLIQNK